jgi:hypothetical protein
MGTHTELLEFLTSLVQAQEDQQTEPETVALALHSQRQRLLQVLDFKVSLMQGSYTGLQSAASSHQPMYASGYVHGGKHVACSPCVRTLRAQRLTCQLTAGEQSRVSPPSGVLICQYTEIRRAEAG